MRRWIPAALLDGAAVLVFVGIGRSVHGHGVTLAGMATTAWPFLGGAAIGWLVARAWRRPFVLLPSAAAVWVGAAGAGMALRVLAGQGSAPAFVGVTFGFLGAEVLGWRLLTLLGRRVVLRSGLVGPAD